jgi:ATP-dependent Clp protease ATP-binding subunit ClpA
MFERFTEKAIKVIMLAQEEARRLGHNKVGTELMLLGLIGEGTGIAAKVLKSSGLDLKSCRKEVEKIIGRGPGVKSIEIPFTPRAKRILELSWDEARGLKHNYIGTEHLILGLIRENGGVAIRVLMSLGIDLHEVESKVRRLIQDSTGTSTGKPPGATSLASQCPLCGSEGKWDKDFCSNCLLLLASERGERAAKVINLAQEEARRSGHNFIGTEQILLGILWEGTGKAAKTLNSFGIRLEDTRNEVEKIIGRGSGFVAVEMPFTPRAKRVLKFAWVESKGFGHDYIGTEH